MANESASQNYNPGLTLMSTLDSLVANQTEDLQTTQESEQNSETADIENSSSTNEDGEDNPVESPPEKIYTVDEE